MSLDLLPLINEIDLLPSEGLALGGQSHSPALHSTHTPCSAKPRNSRGKLKKQNQGQDLCSQDNGQPLSCSLPLVELIEKANAQSNECTSHNDLLPEQASKVTAPTNTEHTANAEQTPSLEQTSPSEQTATLLDAYSSRLTLSDCTLIARNCLLETAPSLQVDYTIAAVSLIGKAHIKAKMPNQDAVYFAPLPQGCLIVVADGVGSNTLAHFGSNLLGRAVEIASHKLLSSLKSLDELNLSGFLMTMHTTWLELLKRQDIDVQESKTTCLIALVFKGKVLLAQLGDGLMGVIECGVFAPLPNPEVQALSFANMTYALGPKVHLSKWAYQIKDLNKFQALILCTDGVVNMLNPAVLSNFMQDYTSFLVPQSPQEASMSIKELLDKWNQEHFTDDMTFACLYPTKQP